MKKRPPSSKMSDGRQSRPDKAPAIGTFPRQWKEQRKMTHTVLVVEDEPNIVLSLQFILKQAGFVVRVARDAEQALRAVDEYVPDLVLLDIMLPRQNGFMVCEQIRANPACRHVKIIMLSAKSREADKERAMSLGADEFVTKPFSTRELSRMVREIISPPKSAQSANPG